MFQYFDAAQTHFSSKTECKAVGGSIKLESSLTIIPALCGNGKKLGETWVSISAMCFPNFKFRWI